MSGRVAVVIGGTGELCGAIAEGLAAAGAEVVLVGRNADKAKARLERINKTGRGWFHPAEVTSKPELAALRDAVVKKSGRIDIVINGAGMNSATPFFDITEEEFKKIVDVNLTSVFLGCQVFGKYLVEQGKGGSIINIGSMAAIVPLSRVFTYSATKAAVHNLTKNLARELAPHKVRVTTLVPGFFPGGAEPQGPDPERVASIMGRTPMKRFGEARGARGSHAPPGQRQCRVVHHGRRVCGGRRLQQHVHLSGMRAVNSFLSPERALRSRRTRA